MKKEHLILIVAGIVIAVLLLKAKKTVLIPVNVIKPGDKSNDVSGLQGALSSMAGIRINNMGAYDNDTLAIVQYYMKDTSALVDYDKGYVDKRFASDLYSIQEKIKNKEL